MRFSKTVFLSVLLGSCLGAPALAAETMYVTDVFEVTMRSGTSTANSIVRMLKSGEAVTVLNWINDIAALVPEHPWLAIYQSWAFICTGQLDQIESMLGKAFIRERMVLGEEKGSASAWYWYRRNNGVK